MDKETKSKGRVRLWPSCAHIRILDSVRLSRPLHPISLLHSPSFYALHRTLRSSGLFEDWVLEFQGDQNGHFKYIQSWWNSFFFLLLKKIPKRMIAGWPSDPAHDSDNALTWWLHLIQKPWDTGAALDGLSNAYAVSFRLYVMISSRCLLGEKDTGSSLVTKLLMWNLLMKQSIKLHRESGS